MSGMMASVTLRAPLAGWLAPIESVPDPVFAEGMMGEGFAIDPIAGEVRAPADATVLTVAPTGHSVSLRLANGAELLIHVGLETVTLGGKGFTPKVKPGDAVATGDLLIGFDLDAVAQGAKALITPVVLAGEGYALSLEPLDRRVGWQDGVARITALAPAAVKGDSEGDSHQRVVCVDAPHGIHARPAARIAALLRTFVAPVAIVRDGKSVNARSTVGLLGLGVRSGDEIIIRGEGSDARAAVEALVALIEAGLGEEAKVDHPAPAPVVPQHGPVTAAPGLAIGQVVQLRVADVDVPRDGQG
ncbi:glucose PTS transporter subunit IIA, partial [Sphingobium yanoikuyae]